MLNGKLKWEDKRHQQCDDSRCIWLSEQFCAFWDVGKKQCNISRIARLMMMIIKDGDEVKM